METTQPTPVARRYGANQTTPPETWILVTLVNMLVWGILGVIVGMITFVPALIYSIMVCMYVWCQIWSPDLPKWHKNPCMYLSGIHLFVIWVKCTLNSYIIILKLHIHNLKDTETITKLRWHRCAIWEKLHCILKHNLKGTETITKLLPKVHGFLCHLRKTTLCKQGSIVITMLSTHILSNNAPHTHTHTHSHIKYTTCA